VNGVFRSLFFFILAYHLPATPEGKQAQCELQSPPSRQSSTLDLSFPRHYFDGPLFLRADCFAAAATWQRSADSTAAKPASIQSAIESEA